MRPPALLLVVLLALTACNDVGEAPLAETTTAAPDSVASEITFTGTPVPLDTAATRIEWTGAKVVGDHDGGFRRFEGALYLDGERLTGADVVIDAASIYTDNERLETHLKSDDFFGVETHPEARFQATTFEPITAADSTGAGSDGMPGATHRVTGLLTMRGQTNQVVFPARVAIAAGTVTADADFIIDRQLWGLSYPGQPDNLIQDEVRLRLHAVAMRPGAQPTTPPDSAATP